MNDNPHSPVIATSPVIVPEDILSRNAKFYRLQLTWISGHYVAGIVALFAGTVAAIVQSHSEIPQEWYFAWIWNISWLWAAFATLLSGAISFLHPLKKGESYKRAYFLISVAIIRYQKQIITSAELLNEYEKGLKIVLDGDSGASEKGKLQDSDNEKNPSGQSLPAK